MFRTSLTSLNNKVYKTLYNQQLNSSSNVKQKVVSTTMKPIPTTSTTLTLVSQPPSNIRPSSAKQVPIQPKQKQITQTSVSKQPQIEVKQNNQFKSGNTNVQTESSYQNKPQTSQIRTTTGGYQQQEQGNQQQEYVNQPQRGIVTQIKQKQTEDLLTTTQQIPKNQRPVSSQAQNSNQKVKPAKPVPLRDQGKFEQLYDCPEGCGRSFNEVALSKHAKICKKVFQQKRKEFNSSKQRQVEQDNLPAKRQPNKNNKSMVKQTMPITTKMAMAQPPAKVNWRAQSEAFRSVLKQGRGVQLDQEQSKLVSQAMINAQNLVPCKWCDRKFNETAAARHIPVCEKKSKENKIRQGGQQVQMQKSVLPQKTQTRVMSGTQKNKQY